MSEFDPFERNRRGEHEPTSDAKQCYDCFVMKSGKHEGENPGHKIEYISPDQDTMLSHEERIAAGKPFNVSHGLCKDCEAREFAAMREKYRRQREAAARIPPPAPAPTEPKTERRRGMRSHEQDVGGQYGMLSEMPATERGKATAHYRSLIDDLIGNLAAEAGEPGTAPERKSELEKRIAAFQRLKRRNENAIARHGPRPGEWIKRPPSNS